MVTQFHTIPHFVTLFCTLCTHRHALYGLQRGLFACLCARRHSKSHFDIRVCHRPGLISTLATLYTLLMLYVLYALYTLYSHVGQQRGLLLAVYAVLLLLLLWLLYIPYSLLVYSLLLSLLLYAVHWLLGLLDLMHTPINPFKKILRDSVSRL